MELQPVGPEGLKEGAAKAEEERTCLNRDRDHQDEPLAKKPVDQHHCGKIRVYWQERADDCPRSVRRLTTA